MRSPEGYGERISGRNGTLLSSEKGSGPVIGSGGALKNEERASSDCVPH
jgi:hypothetical protein